MQCVEKGEKAGPGGQELRCQRREGDQSGVEQHQFAPLVEDRQADGELGECLGQGLHEIAQGYLGTHKPVAGQGGTPQAVVGLARHGDLEPQRALGRSGDARIMMRQCQVTAAQAAGFRRWIEMIGKQAGQWPSHLWMAHRCHTLDQGDIRGIGPDHPAIGAHPPDRAAGRIEGLAEIGNLFIQRREAGAVDDLPTGACLARADGDHQPVMFDASGDG